ncbi:MAG TPA: molybdopterin molybdotransferase MoeA [Pyrinomonadaceae bacterium]|nr:molybdopterin molybdotransferase MoeA [Pyrinomonadaceae bacterium]
MIPLEKALKLVERNIRRLGNERIELGVAIGRILAEDIFADGDQPPFDRSMMDGFAVAAADIANTPAVLKIVGEAAAGRGWHNNLKRGEAVRIMTGAPVPKGADSVQRVELTRSYFTDAQELVEILEPAKKGMSVVKKGSEIRRGKRLFVEGDTITSQNIAALAAFGYARPRVAKRPRIAIFGTGTEIVEIAQKPGADQIRNSNSITLAALSASFGAVPEIFPNAKDDLASLKQMMKTAIRGHDILITTGGVSVGKYDLTKAALKELGAEIFFEKVALKPGKPIIAARLGKALVFSLPGNPVSAAVTFYLFVRAAIVGMQGVKRTSMREGTAVLADGVKAAKDRHTLAPARLSNDECGRLIASPLRGKGSSDLVSFAGAEALISLEMNTRAEAGSLARILYL